MSLAAAYRRADAFKWVSSACPPTHRVYRLIAALRSYAARDLVIRQTRIQSRHSCYLGFVATYPMIPESSVCLLTKSTILNAEVGTKERKNITWQFGRILIKLRLEN